MVNSIERNRVRSRVGTLGMVAAMVATEAIIGVPLVNSLSVRQYEIKGKDQVLDCSKASLPVDFAAGLGEGQTLGLSGMDMLVAPLDPLVTVLGTGDGGLKVRIRETGGFVDAASLKGKQIKGVSFGENSFKFAEAGRIYDATYNPSAEEAGKTSIRLVMECIKS